MKLQQHLYLIQQANALSFLISTHFYDAFYDVNVWRKDTWYLIYDNCYEKFRFLISILSDVVSVVMSVWNEYHVISKDLSLSQFYKSYKFHHFDQNTIWWHTSFLVILLRHLQQHFKDNTLPRATYNFPNLLRH